MKAAELETWLSVLPSVSYACPRVTCVKVVGSITSRLQYWNMFRFRFDALVFHSYGLGLPHSSAS